jgi:DNA-binding MarR family transcriptional regulator
MAYTGMFLKALASYKLELGEAFPSADPRSVLLVLKECDRPESRSQKQIESAAGISQSNAAKLMARMAERGWLEGSRRDPKTGLKEFIISYEGALVLRRFEEACRRAAKDVPKRKGPAT